MSKVDNKPARSRQIRGRVLGALTDGEFLVDIAGKAICCRRAYSCLVIPEPGDRVMLVGDAGPIYITAILERQGNRSVRIAMDGDLTVKATGHICLEGTAGASLHGGKNLDLAGEQVTLQSKESEFIAEKAAFLCAEVQGHVGLLRLIGNSMEAVFQRMAQTCRHSFRAIAGTDHLRAAHMDHEASESLRLHARNMLLTAEDLTKIDADQIHLG